MSLDYFTTTLDAAAAVAREDADDDRPTLAELAGRCPECESDDFARCETCWTMDDGEDE